MIVCSKHNQFVIIDTNKKRAFRTDTLSKAVTFMITIPSRLWTSYLIKIIYMGRFGLTKSLFPSLCELIIELISTALLLASN